MQVETNWQPQPSWPLPAEIPWQSVQIESWQAAVPAATNVGLNSTTWLSEFMIHYEASLHGYVQGPHDRKLPQKCQGRARRLSPALQPPKPVCVRPSRPGEEALCSDFVGLEVTRWFRQLRRLQSLSHALRAAKNSPAALEYRLSLWRSVLRAPGFSGGFVAWWASRPVQHVGCPSSLPGHVPSLPVLSVIFHDFRDNFKRFEAWHIRQRSAVLQDKYKNSQIALLHALREPATEQVDTLVLERRYTVLAVDSASSQVFVDMRGTSTWSVSEAQVLVTDVEESTCTVAGPVVLCEGDELDQVQVISSLPDLHTEFLQFWKPKWQRHPCPSLSDWQRIISFATAFLPSFEFRFDDITPALWYRAVKRMKPRAARGPDGIARSDLLHMPPILTKQLLDKLRQVETEGAEWPAQWLEGHVICLDKQTGRSDVNSYRPIVLLSIVYRLWAGIRARQALKQLSAVLECSAFGFLPGHEPLEFWLLLQAEIETSCETGAPLHGLSTDIVKAFNCLPRLPLFCAAKVLGFPLRLLCPWAHFLGGLRRRFVLRGSVTEALPSDVGFPEGCPLSTLAMAVTDVLFHRYLEVFEPRVLTYSFVDNLALSTDTAGILLKGHALTDTFCGLLGLQLDEAKTYVWSTCQSARKAFRQAGFRVLTHARDLGGLMAYGRAVSVSDLRQRCTALQPVWRSLQRVPAPLARKLMALPVKCWARALHGANGCPAADSIVQDLRTSATRALGLRSAGASSMLRLSLAEPPEADPGFYQVWKVLVDFRRLCDKQPSLLAKWRGYLRRYDGRYYQGPFSKLLQLMAQLGWHAEIPPQFVDQEGFHHDLLGMPLNLLRSVVRRAWLFYVASQHRHRDTMSDMLGMEPALCHLDASRLSPLDRARLSAIQSGAFLFEAHHSRYDVTKTGLCQRCGVPDTVRHRLCECPRYSEARDEVGWATSLWPVLPKSMTHHLIAPSCPLFLEFRRYLAGLPMPLGFRPVPFHPEELQHLFTDGSGLCSGFADLGLAAWAVVHAGSGQVIDAGPLPGLLQTVPRAELLAVIRATEWSLFHRVRTAVWSDALHIVHGTQALLSGADVTINQDNADLWRRLRASILRLESGQLVINHVPSHLSANKLVSPFEDWLSQHNNHADTAAVQANINRSDYGCDLYRRVVQRFETQAGMLRSLRKLFFHIAEEPISSTQRLDVEEVDVRPMLATAAAGALDELVPLGWRSTLGAHSLLLPQEFVVAIWDFLIKSEGANVQKFLVTWLELASILSEIQDFPFPAICPRTGRWVSAVTLPFAPGRLTLAAQYGLVRRAAVAGLQHFGLSDLVITGTDLSVLGVHRPQDGVVFGVDPESLFQAREKLRSFCRSRPLRNCADMARPF